MRAGSHLHGPLGEAGATPDGVDAAQIHHPPTQGVDRGFGVVDGRVSQRGIVGGRACVRVSA